MNRKNVEVIEVGLPPLPEVSAFTKLARERAGRFFDDDDDSSKGREENHEEMRKAPQSTGKRKKREEFLPKMSLDELSEGSGFSLDYLCDLACSIGSQCPVNPHAPMGDILSGEQIGTVMEAVSSLDATDVNMEYSWSLRRLQRELGVDMKALKKMCEELQIPLHLGDNTILHDSLVEKLRQARQFSDDEDVVGRGEVG